MNISPSCFFLSSAHLFGRLVGRTFTLLLVTFHHIQPCALSKRLFLIYSTAKRKIVYTERRKKEQNERRIVWICARFADLSPLAFTFVYVIFCFLHLPVYLGLPFDNSVTQFHVNLLSWKGREMWRIEGKKSGKIHVKQMRPGHVCMCVLGKLKEKKLLRMEN